jgi:hypothetical protein
VLLRLLFGCVSAATHFRFSLLFYFYLSKVISNWDRSGNGCGNRNDAHGLGEDDRRFGSYPRTETFSRDDRKDFLLGFSPHILYFWEITDNMNLLQSALTVLQAELCASSEC